MENVMNVLAQMVTVNGEPMTVAALVQLQADTQARLAEVLEQVEILEEQVAQGGVKKSTGTGASEHKNNPWCKAVIQLMSQVTKATTRELNKKEQPLITESEWRLWAAFEQSGYNIKRAGEIYECSHTNVWQRLYGKDKFIPGGLLSKLMKHFNIEKVEDIEFAQVETEVEPAEVEIA